MNGRTRAGHISHGSANGRTPKRAQVFVSNAPQQSYTPGTGQLVEHRILLVDAGDGHRSPEQPKGALLGPWSRPFWNAVALLAFSPVSTVYAQHASDDPLATANDAFGLTLGLESIGLYNPGGVRGFNPQSAGNVRIDGLYFDQQGA